MLRLIRLLRRSSPKFPTKCIRRRILNVHCQSTPFSYFTPLLASLIIKKKMYIAITPRWTIFTWGVVALILAWVPFIAFYKGTIIRAHSKYSKILMREERERIEREKEILDGMG